jgi:nucleotide-binding universal stress UspA family protein
VSGSGAAGGGSLGAVGRILCATDLSRASASAWTFARRLAGATGADVVLLYVLAPLPSPTEGLVDPATADRLVSRAREQARADLEQYAGTAEPGLVVTARVVAGPVATAIVTTAEQEGADLVVVGTHGRSGLDRLLLGSVAEQVIHLATRPVVTVRPLTPPAPPSPPGSLRILYATDLSAGARRAWPWARALAEAAGAELEVVSVVPEAGLEQDLDAGLAARAQACLGATARAEAERLVAGAGLPAGRLRVHVVVGREAEEIVGLARTRAAHLVVMGTHGRTALEGLALGSVARRVLHAAPCPVLTVGPHAGEGPGRA